MSPSVIEAAADFADRMLFPSAMESDAAATVPRSHLDGLAAAGLYGVTGPRGSGGQDVDERRSSKSRSFWPTDA